jgi:hypothetical protein
MARGIVLTLYVASPYTAGFGPMPVKFAGMGHEDIGILWG